MKHRIYSLLAILLMIVSCQSKKDSQDQKSEFDSQTTAEIQEEIRATAPDLPPPDEFAARLQATGAEFFEGIINDPAKADQYINDVEGKSAANIGIYFADLAYTSAYEQNESSMKILEAMVKLSKRLGIESSLVNSIMERFNNYMSVPDSVRTYLQEYSDNATEYLSEMGRGQMAAIMFTGFYFEGLYLAQGIIDNYPKDELSEDARITILLPVYRAILEQKENVSKIQDYVEESTSGDDADNYYLQAISELEEIYASLDVEEKISNNQLKELTEDPNLKKLRNKIIEIRSSIIE